MAARTDAQPAALSRQEIRENLEGNAPPTPPDTPDFTADTEPASRATPTGDRCVHCAHRIMRRKGVEYCDAPWTCRRGPVPYTGLQQLHDLGLIDPETAP